MKVDPDLSDAFALALKCCPDLDDDEAVMRHLHELRLELSRIGATAFDALVDEARAQRARGEHHAF